MVHQISLQVLVPLLCLADIQQYATAWIASPATTTGVARMLSPATVASTRPRPYLTSTSAPTTPARSVVLFSQVVAEAEKMMLKEVDSEALPLNMKVNEVSVKKTTMKKKANAGACPLNIKKGNIESAKSLLKKYGVAYLGTSISLSILSMSLCYFSVSNGVDVGALLAKLGINGSAKKAGTFAIAYAAHKAASPIRFPPTVILSRYTAKLIGKKPAKVQQETMGLAQ